MQQANRHLINAHQTLNQTIADLGKDDDSALWTYHNGELSLAMLIVRLVRNKRLQRKAIRAYNRTVVVK